MQKVVVKAPVSGVIFPVEQVPDPVFSQKLVGDGLSIDPVDQCLSAPFDGRITQLHRAGHAVTVTHDSGIDVLMHIGIDTVSLKSQGFRVKVTEGQEVVLGQALIEFDADFIATHAKSLLTQIVLPGPDRIQSVAKASGHAIAGKTDLLVVTLAEKRDEEGTDGGQEVISPAVIVPNPTGLHARPAAVLAGLTRKFDAAIELLKGDSRANARSVVAIMKLNVAYRDKVQLRAVGPDAAAAITEILPQLEGGLGDEGATPISAPAAIEKTPDNTPSPQPRSGDPNLLLGVVAAPGVAVGTSVRIRKERFDFPETADDSHRENVRLDRALEEAKNHLEALQTNLNQQGLGAKAAIFAAHCELLDDPDLIDMVRRLTAKGKSAEYAWRHAVEAAAGELAALPNAVLAGRANDLRDVGNRVMRILTGKEAETLALPDDAIFIAEELDPSFLAAVDTAKVRGFCTTTGGATSHAAILARAMDIAAVAGIEASALDIVDGTPLILDAGKGMLRVHPSEEQIAETRRRLETMAAQRREDLKTAREPAVTTDGLRIEVTANIGSVAEARQSVGMGGDGVGLLRSEFLFLERMVAPDEEEQYQVYRDALLALEGRPMIIRTLDVGGDKPLPYLPMPMEQNPFLGQRGIRIGLERPELFRAQARAVLRAGAHGRIRIMFPMIATVGELRAAKAMLEEERSRLSAAGIETGIMIEVPSAAVTAEQFAAEVDFFSVGTNDLTQYCLAMDRGHPKLAPLLDGLHPAVLHLIQTAARGIHKQGKWIGVCGGIASDTQAVPVLIGLGVDELSVSVPSLPAIKAEVRRWSARTCRELTEKALQCVSGAEVRQLVEKAKQGESQ